MKTELLRMLPALAMFLLFGVLLAAVLLTGRRERHPVIRFLLWVGFVKIGRKSTLCRAVNGNLEYVYPEQVIWPFHAPPAHAFKDWRSFCWMCKYHGYVYRFKNLPGVISRRPGRLLPVRWGFGICGFEFGDRG